MKMKCTQYGVSEAAGGWDGKGDSGTDSFLGNANNTLVNGVSCALSPSARAKLNTLAPHGNIQGYWLSIVFSNGFQYLRRVDDSTSAELLDDRVDFFNAYAFDKQMDAAGQFADVQVIHLGAVIS